MGTELNNDSKLAEIKKARKTIIYSRVLMIIVALAGFHQINLWDGAPLIDSVAAYAGAGGLYIAFYFYLNSKEADLASELSELDEHLNN